MRRIGFVGLGNIGRPMAERLKDRGFDILGCDIDPKALEALRRLGARVTGRTAECAGEDLIVMMVASDAQLEQACLGADGLIAAIDPARAPLLAVMSTVLPETVRSVARALAQSGVRVVDAPVSGGSLKARDGTLTIMAGGEADDLARARPVLEQLGQTIHHCGALGSGMLTKLINNLVGVTTHYLLAEAMTIAQKNGMNPATLAAVMESSSGRTSGTGDWSATENIYRYNAASRESFAAVVAVTRKDLAHAVELARTAGAATPMLDAVARAHADTPDDQLFAAFRALSS